MILIFRSRKNCSELFVFLQKKKHQIFTIKGILFVFIIFNRNGPVSGKETKLNGH